MTSLRLVLRGLRWRWATSISVALVAVVAMVGGALGPLYANSAADSLVREGLSQAGLVSTGVQVRAQRAGQTQFSPEDLMTAVDERAADPSLDQWYGQETLSLTVGNGVPHVDDRELGLAQVGWHRGQCDAVVITAGSCPDAPGEAMVSARTAERVDIAVGDFMQLGITADRDDDRVEIVGLYDQDTADASAWGLASPAQLRSADYEQGADQLDEVVVDKDTMLRTGGDIAAVSFRSLDAASVHQSQLPSLLAAVTAATEISDTTAAGIPNSVVTSGLPNFLGSLNPTVDEVVSASFAVTASLVLLAWFALFLVISATSEERSGEIALAKLRGMSARSTVMFGLTEPILLLLAAVPVGLAIAYGVEVALTSRVLAPGTEVTLTPAVLVALAISFLGGVAAAAIAARSILTAPVMDQLRRTGGRRARLARSVAIDAAAIALMAAGIYQLKRGGSDVLALLTPGLIALTAGLLAVRVLPRIARAQVARTRGSSRVASFLASRNIARRPSGLRIVVLLSLAVGLSVFAIDSWAVASANRVDAARAETGGYEVLHVHSDSAGSLLSAVRAADPSGTMAMAAVVSSNQQGGLVAVDAERVGAVAAWDPEWTGSSRSTIGAKLHPAPTVPSIPLRDSVSFDVDYDRTDGEGDVTFRMAIRAATGLIHMVEFDELRAGSSTIKVDLPMCVAEACTIEAFTFTQPIGATPSTATGTVTLSNMADSVGPIDLTSSGIDGWRSGAAAIPFPIPPGAVISVPAPGQLVTSFTIDASADAAIELTDHPAALPVFLGSDLAQSTGTDSTPTTQGLDGEIIPVQQLNSGVLPRILRGGALADLSYALDAMGRAPLPLDYQVWLADDAPESIRATLEAGGFTVTGVDTVDQRVAELSRGGTALALQLFVVAALIALAIGAGTMLANTYVTVRRRAYELAALRSLGASNGVLVRAGRLEQVALAFTGAVLGAVSGLVGAALTLPSLLESASAEYPAPWIGPAWTPVAAVMVAVLAVLAIVAEIGARRTARLAQPDLLREVQE